MTTGSLAQQRHKQRKSIFHREELEGHEGFE